MGLGLVFTVVSIVFTFILYNVDSGINFDYVVFTMIGIDYTIKMMFQCLFVALIIAFITQLFDYSKILQAKEISKMLDKKLEEFKR